jgi:hypothetical protein
MHGQSIPKLLAQVPGCPLQEQIDILFFDYREHEMCPFKTNSSQKAAVGTLSNPGSLWNIAFCGKIAIADDPAYSITRIHLK